MDKNNITKTVFWVSIIIVLGKLSEVTEKIKPEEKL